MVTLTRRVRKRLLCTANVAMALAIAAVVACAVMVPVERPDAETHALRPLPPAPAPPREIKELPAYAVIYERDLGFSALVEAATPAPALTLRIVGTVIEPGFSSAYLETAEGKHKLASVGDTVGGAEVTAITAETVTVLFQGKSLTLPVEKGRSGK